MQLLTQGRWLHTVNLMPAMHTIPSSPLESPANTPKPLPFRPGAVSQIMQVSRPRRISQCSQPSASFYTPSTPEFFLEPYLCASITNMCGPVDGLGSRLHVIPSDSYRPGSGRDVALNSGTFEHAHSRIPPCLLNT